MKRRRYPSVPYVSWSIHPGEFDIVKLARSVSCKTMRGSLSKERTATVSQSRLSGEAVFGRGTGQGYPKHEAAHRFNQTDSGCCSAWAQYHVQVLLARMRQLRGCFLTQGSQGRQRRSGGKFGVFEGRCQVRCCFGHRKCWLVSYEAGCSCLHHSCPYVRIGIHPALCRQADKSKSGGPGQLLCANVWVYIYIRCSTYLAGG